MEMMEWCFLTPSHTPRIGEQIDGSHSATLLTSCSDSGIRDFGVEGIETFLCDHSCGVICHDLCLDPLETDTGCGDDGLIYNSTMVEHIRQNHLRAKR